MLGKNGDAHLHKNRYCTVCRQITRQTRLRLDDVWRCSVCGTELPEVVNHQKKEQIDELRNG